MFTYAKRVGLAAVDVDLTTIRWVSALRRSAVVVAILVGGIVFVDASAGVSGATAALIIGILDKGRSPRSTWQTMASATALLAGIALVVGLISTSTVAMLTLVCLLAFISGVSFGVDQRAPQIFVFAALMAATLALEFPDAHRSLGTATLIVIAGALQTLFAIGAAPIVGDLPERKRVIAAARATAASCQQVSNPNSVSQSAALLASTTMTAADDIIRRSDLAATHRERYALLLADIDQIRTESRAYHSRQKMGLRAPTDLATRDSFVAASQVLVLAADSIEHPSSTTSLRELERAVQTHQVTSQTKSMTRVGRAVIESLDEIPEHVRAIVDSGQVHRARRASVRPLPVRISAAFSRGSLPLRYGLRMALGALIGQLLAAILGLTHGSWVSVTIMMLLRPDVGPTPPRVLMRAVGTSVGMAIVVAIVWASGGSTTILVSATAVFVVATYTLVSVNYGTFVALLATTVVLMLTINGFDPYEIALARWVDVLLGCVVGSALALLLPLWKRTQLKADVASYADAVSSWLTAIAIATQLPAAQRADGMIDIRKQGRAAATARQNADATLATSLLEPPTKRVNPGTIGVIMAWIRHSSEAGIAAETLLRHGANSDLLAASHANSAASDLASTASILRSPRGSTVSQINSQPMFATDSPESGRLGQLLLRCARSANAAVRAAQRINGA